MKKRLAIFGGEMFETIKYESREFVPIFNKVVNELYMDYEVYNFSIVKSLDFKRRMIETFTNSYNFSTVILEIGEIEVKQNYHEFNRNICEYKKTISDIIKTLVDKKIEVIIYLLQGNTKQILEMNKILVELSKVYKVKIAADKKQNYLFDKPKYMKMKLQYN